MISADDCLSHFVLTALGITCYLLYGLFDKSVLPAFALGAAIILHDLSRLSWNQVMIMVLHANVLSLFLG